MQRRLRLRFGFFLPHVVDPSAGERYRPSYELCQLAESVGFEFVAMGHHRFTPESKVDTAPLLLLAAIAARTSRLRLSSAVFLLPLYNPIDIAEQIATLDQISDGRTMLSFGMGYLPYEYEHSGVAYSRRGSRTEEAVQILRLAWTEERVHFSGRNFQVDGTPVVPKPVQSPHPPIWLGGGSSAGVDRAARLADGWMVDTTKAIHSVQRRVAAYRKTAADLGRPSQVCLVRQVGIGPTRDYVEDVWLPDMARQLFWVWEAGGRFTNGELLARRMRAGELPTLQEFAGGRDIAGTPDDCIEQIRQFQKVTGCEYFCGIFGDAPVVETLSAAIELFGREVIPAFQ
jgi:probable F420-dependent oxidoreductase